METDKLRGVFAQFLASHNLHNALKLDSSCTVHQDNKLKYERIDRYRILFLRWDECKALLEFCTKHDMSVWFGADKLCIGYNYRGNMRLSAFSVPLRSAAAVLPADRKETNDSVPLAPEISGMVPDRIHDEPGAATSSAPLPPQEG